MHLLPEPTEHGPVQTTLDILVVYSNNTGYCSTVVYSNNTGYCSSVVYSNSTGYCSSIQ